MEFTVALVGVGVSLLLATGCGASEDAGSTGNGPSQPIVLSGFTGERLEIMREVSAKLGDASLLSRAELVSAPPPLENEDGSKTPNRENDAWLNLVSDAPLDKVEHAKATWEASLVLAAFWRRLNEEQDKGLRGGSLTFTAPLAKELEPPSLEYHFASDAGTYLFTDAAGRPSPLAANEQTLEAAILSEAEIMGLTVDEIEFSGIEGTAVSVEATANDPLAFVQTYGGTYGNLFGDPGLLEGIFLVVREPGGDLVKTASWSTGLQGGAGGLSEEYKEYDSEGVDDE